MKEVVIVEDKPWVTGKAVQNLQQKGVSVLRIVYYPNAFGDEDEKKRLIGELLKKTNVEIDKVTNQEEFVEKMQELYEADNVVFFMDYDLKGDFTMEPDSRINIRYAKHKEKINPEKRKIWFYTVTGVANVEVITQMFPGRVLRVDTYEDGQLVWNEDDMKKILG